MTRGPEPRGQLQGDRRLPTLPALRHAPRYSKPIETRYLPHASGDPSHSVAWPIRSPRGLLARRQGPAPLPGRDQEGRAVPRVGGLGRRRATMRVARRAAIGASTPQRKPGSCRVLHLPGVRVGAPARGRTMPLARSRDPPTDHLAGHPPMAVAATRDAAPVPGHVARRPRLPPPVSCDWGGHLSGGGSTLWQRLDALDPRDQKHLLRAVGLCVEAAPRGARRGHRRGRVGLALGCGAGPAIGSAEPDAVARPPGAHTTQPGRRSVEV
jgi:hypothetical protein